MRTPLTLPAATTALLVLALAPAPAPAAADDSIRCEGGIVSLGDTKLDLLGKCGHAALVERVAEERGGALVRDGEQVFSSQTASVTVERWTYNFGPRRFTQIVRVEGGRVAAIDRGSYGYDLGSEPSQAGIPRARCGHLSIHEGDRVFDLLARCGEPASRDVTVVTRRLVQEVKPGVQRVEGKRGTRERGPLLVESATATFNVEVWIYDFGPQVLTRIVELEDGVVTGVTTGGHGYSR